VGPKAFQALAAAGINIAQNLEKVSVREAVQRYKEGAVTWSELSDAKGRRI
jgi:predicted Fe-Mo cluster-binding NifX family protein